MAVWVWILVGWLALGALVALLVALLAKGGRLREEAEAPREPEVVPEPRTAPPSPRTDQRRTPR